MAEWLIAIDRREHDWALSVLAQRPGDPRVVFTLAEAVARPRHAGGNHKNSERFTAMPKDVAVTGD